MPNTAFAAVSRREHRRLPHRINRVGADADRLVAAAGMKFPAALEHRLTQALHAMVNARAANGKGRHELANMTLTQEIRRICADLHIEEPARD